MDNQTKAREEASSAYTLVLGDAETRIRCTSADAVVVTIPPSSEVPWVVGTDIRIQHGSSTSLDIVGGVGVTIDQSMRENEFAARLCYKGADQWERTPAGLRRNG